MTVPVRVVAGDVTLDGEMTLPEPGRGVVLFAHGSGSGRRSARNLRVAAALSARGLGTVLFDLLTPAEAAWDARTAALRFDIALLTDRVTGAVDWAVAEPGLAGHAVGLFGASTGAAAALGAAARRPSAVAAVVSRGGRPDLAREALPAVRAPTLLIVGGHDHEVRALNERARARLTCPVALAVVPGAGHLFEEPGALERVAGLAGDWFTAHLGADGPAPG